MQFQELMQLPYQELVAEVLRQAPQGTWYAKRDWLETQYTPQQIAEMYYKLYLQLVEFTPDDQLENPAADDLRDVMDIFCIITKHELIENLIRGKSNVVDSAQ